MTKRIHFPLRETVAAVALTFTALTGLALAHEYSVGPLKIDHPWARATPRGAKVGGGYAVITNTGSMPDRLVGGSLSAAGHVEIHRMTMEGDVMKMGPVEGGLEIKPGQTVKLEPGGFHIMFMDFVCSGVLIIGHGLALPGGAHERGEAAGQSRDGPRGVILLDAAHHSRFALI